MTNNNNHKEHAMTQDTITEVRCKADAIKFTADYFDDDVAFAIARAVQYHAVKWTTDPWVPETWALELPDSVYGWEVQPGLDRQAVLVVYGDRHADGPDVDVDDERLTDLLAEWGDQW